MNSNHSVHVSNSQDAPYPRPRDFMVDDKSVVVPCTFLGSTVCVLHSSYVSAIIVNTFIYSPIHSLPRFGACSHACSDLPAALSRLTAPDPHSPATRPRKADVMHPEFSAHCYLYFRLPTRICLVFILRTFDSLECRVGRLIAVLSWLSSPSLIYNVCVCVKKKKESFLAFVRDRTALTSLSLDCIWNPWAHWKDSHRMIFIVRRMMGGQKETDHTPAWPA